MFMMIIIHFVSPGVHYTETIIRPVDSKHDLCSQIFENKILGETSGIE